MNVMAFLLEECELQNDFSLSSVNNLRKAYEFACWRYKENPTIFYNDILYVGQLVKPNLNTKGIRTTPVIFKNLELGLAPELIERSLSNLLENQRSLTPEEFYIEFEKIHPFEDGNGRVGAILYNLLKDQMEDPELPPEFVE